MDLKTVSEVLNLPKSTLRFWEKEGIIASQRSENNYRYYLERYIIDVSDVIVLRQLHIGLKEIPEVRNMTCEEQNQMLADLICDADKQIVEYQKIKNLAAQRQSILQKIQEFKDNPYWIVKLKNLGFEEGLVRYNFYDKAAAAAYLANPYLGQYCIYFEQGCYTAFREAWIQRNSDVQSEVLWRPTAEEMGKRFLRCLLECDSTDNAINNLPEHFMHMEMQGLKPGKIIAKYLQDVYSEEKGGTQTYYETYIEVLEDS